mgnify:CR=1 FL=1
MTEPPKDCVWLRVLSTSDTHGHLLGYDYARAAVVEAWGLARAATCISRARADAPVSILLDNGDFLQGTPLAQLFCGQAHGGPHPVLSAMEAMGYDAIGLGNHEFNYGLDRLDEITALTQIPVLCANVLTAKGATPQEDIPFRPPSVILHREVTDPQNGETVELRIGVLSVLPTQILTWDGAHLAGRVEVRDMVEAAKTQAAKLREAGADLVILLAHTGIDPAADGPEAENAATALARVPGVDAMVTGHTHKLFPDAAVQGAELDTKAGTIGGVPTVMPGYRGSHVGVIDLFLQRDDAGWSVASHHVMLQPVEGVEEDPEVVAAIARAHQATLDYITRPLGQSSRPIHSYFSQLRDDLPTRLVAMAQYNEIKSRLEGTSHAHLPLLSASAPYQTGGRSGPTAYVDIPAGPLSVRDANTLYPFPNALCAVLTSGAELHDWLERSASAFLQIKAGQGAQPLLNPAFPGHAIDTIYGLTYQIDLRLPPAFDENGARLRPAGEKSRVQNLCMNGAPVRADDQFVVAVSGYRAYGGGPYASCAPQRVVVQTDARGLESVVSFVQSGGVDTLRDDPCWHFVPVVGASALFATGPGLAQHGDDIARLGASVLGPREDGFIDISLPLDRNTCESAA